MINGPWGGRECVAFPVSSVPCSLRRGLRIRATHPDHCDPTTVIRIGGPVESAGLKGGAGGSAAGAVGETPANPPIRWQRSEKALHFRRTGSRPTPALFALSLPESPPTSFPRVLPEVVMSVVNYMIRFSTPFSGVRGFGVTLENMFWTGPFQVGQAYRDGVLCGHFT